MLYEVENILLWTMKTKGMEFAEIADDAVSVKFFK